ncbi:androgen-induced gene 1 protein-like [Saccoglossus kowalevskii]
MTLIFVHIAMHSVFLSVYLYTEFYDQTFIMPNIPYTFGGNTKYLTHWNLVFQIFYFGLSITIHLVMSCNKRSQFGRRLCRFRDWFLAAIAFPFASIVVFIFWTLCVIDRELISNIPPRLQELIPVWLNQVIGDEPGFQFR